MNPALPGSFSLYRKNDLLLLCHRYTKTVIHFMQMVEINGNGHKHLRRHMESCIII